MLLKARSTCRQAHAFLRFSTLYRVDAIEGMTATGLWPRSRTVSVPSIGSMLLKAVFMASEVLTELRFSTLYRVDAIEGGVLAVGDAADAVVSVPSIGSMLLKATSRHRRRARALGVSVPSIGSMLLKACGSRPSRRCEPPFQYPLSGRCY